MNNTRRLARNSKISEGMRGKTNNKKEKVKSETITFCCYQEDKDFFEEFIKTHKLKKADFYIDAIKKQIADNHE